MSFIILVLMKVIVTRGKKVFRFLGQFLLKVIVLACMLTVIEVKSWAVKLVGTRIELFHKRKKKDLKIDLK